MKRFFVWFLIGSLVVVTASDVHYYAGLQHNYQVKEASSPTMVFLSALRGTQKKATLPDGTTVWLNAASSLAYPADISEGNRTVELFGEAFFDVPHQASHPFKVRARDMLIEVLGTRFDVRNYPDEIQSRVSVSAGAIRVCYHDQLATLHPGDAVAVEPAALTGKVFTFRSDEDTTAVTGWTKGLLSYKDRDLPSLVRELSRVYNVDIQLNGPVSDHRFDGTLSVQEPLEEVIERLIVPYSHARITRPASNRIVITVAH